MAGCSVKFRDMDKENWMSAEREAMGMNGKTNLIIIKMLHFI